MPDWSGRVKSWSGSMLRSNGVLGTSPHTGRISSSYTIKSTLCTHTCAGFEKRHSSGTAEEPAYRVFLKVTFVLEA
jgi:hypothetical protein